MFSRSRPPTPTFEPTAATPATFTDGLPLPRLLVFDLDYTLWPFWVDTHVSSPLRAKDSNARVVDKAGESFAFYKDVPQILLDARAKGIKVAAASRTHAPELAREMLKLLHVEKGRRALDCFDYLQIFPGSKTTHFSKLQTQTSVLYSDMLFFDDEARNKNVETLGVVMYLVLDGVSKDEVDRGVREWRKRRPQVVES